VILARQSLKPKMGKNANYKLCRDIYAFLPRGDLPKSIRIQPISPSCPEKLSKCACKWAHKKENGEHLAIPLQTPLAKLCSSSSVISGNRSLVLAGDFNQALRGFRDCISRRRHLAENLSRGMFRADAQHDPCWMQDFLFRGRQGLKPDLIWG
jgi:hypothetical protein